MPDTPADHDRQERLRRAPVPAPAGIAVRYQPIWNVRQKTIGIHVAEPAWSADGTWADAGLRGDMDRQIVARVLADIAAEGQQDAVGSVCLPAHFASLATAAPRGALLEACERIPAGRRSFLLWEIIALPEAVGETALFSVLSAIKPYGRAIFVRRELDQIEFDALAAIGIHAVGTDLRRTAGAELTCARRLERFAEHAHAAGLRCHVHGLVTRSLSLAAIAAGFDYLAGPAIAGATDRPWGVVPYDVETLFLREHLVPGARIGGR